MADNHFYTDVEVTGLVEQLDRLRTFDRDTYDAMKSELASAGDDIARDAKRDTPEGTALRNWGPWNSATVARKTRNSVRITQRKKLRPIPYDGGAARSGIESRVDNKFRKGRMLSAVVRVVQKNPAGAIWSLAGSDSTDWGATGGSGLFRQNLNKKYGVGPWPRALTPAWQKHKDEAIDRIERTIDKYAQDASGN
jgi:hypothetical protein